MDDFDYKKHSLERLEEWVHDCLSAAEASPQEIYGVIKKTVEEQYYCYKHHTSRAYELLALLNGNGKGHIPAYDSVMKEREYYEYSQSELEKQREIDKKLFACDMNNSSSECKGAWDSFWEENYYPEDRKEPKIEDIMPPWGHSDMEALRYTEEELNAMCDAAQEQQDKVKKWVLPVEMHPSGEYFILLPDDLLEAANLKEGDTVEWIDNNDGSFTFKKND